MEHLHREVGGVRGKCGEGGREGRWEREKGGGGGGGREGETETERAEEKERKREREGGKKKEEETEGARRRRGEGGRGKGGIERDIEGKRFRVLSTAFFSSSQSKVLSKVFREGK